jgi:hypothetical protein
MKYSYFLVFLVIINTGCKKICSKPEECDKDSYLLSELKTRTDHHLPFTLCGDIDGVKSVFLNNEEVNLDYGHELEFEKSGFFELIINYNDTEKERDSIVFTLVTEEREAAEWGIEAWVPVPFETGILPSCEIECIYSRRFIDGMGVPFIFYLTDNGSLIEGYYSASSTTENRDFYIKRGVGSIMLESEYIEESQDFSIGDESIQLALTRIEETPTNLSGEITEDMTVPENTIIRITGDLTITSSASLTINAGVIMLVDEAVNIYNDGPVTIHGTKENPVLITCTQKGKYWGGFISNDENSVITANYAIFCQSGYHDTGDYTSWGHAKRQGLFYTSNSELHLDHCYMIDHIGQIFYPKNARLTLESILVQRVKTSGQLNYTNATITNSVFTDFPDDSQEYIDEDNDALYINASDVTIDNCIFMFAKDDGMDSGGDEGGTVTVTNTRFEACFHEGSALSSNNEVVKTHTFQNCVFYNCGQGLELGFSSPNHSVIAENCQFLNNYIGIRYGDNYDWSQVYGSMYIRNSQSLYNGKDVWNMVRNRWAPRLENMHFENVQISTYTEQYPDLEIITN